MHSKCKNSSRILREEFLTTNKGSVQRESPVIIPGDKSKGRLVYNEHLGQSFFKGNFRTAHFSRSRYTVIFIRTSKIEVQTGYF